jgi:2,4-dienoyl-CoA reductase-like NADH-dependent reductase (Old Yellow Enzyme family)
MTGAAASTAEPLLRPGRIGGVELRNRFVRSATSETLADADGRILTPDYRRFYEQLADGGVGLLLTGHCYVHRRGRYTPGMTGLSEDAHVEPFVEVIDAVHARGARIFAQLNHVGSQSRMQDVVPLAPSPVANAQTGRAPVAATEADIREVIDAYRAAARRALAAGFDGVHLHAGHGYLLSSFLSPHANQRRDEWGGPLRNRQRLLLEVVEAVRDGADDRLPVTVKLGVRDYVPDGLAFEDALETATALEAAGVAALEVSAGLTSPRIESAQQYTAVTRRRAAQDKLVHRLLARTPPEGYFAPEARQLRDHLGIPIILVGGLRTVEYMASVIADGVADFVSLSRPLIREPDLVRTIEAGRTGLVACTSCNICLTHEGVHSLRCWRVSNRRLAVHAYYRLRGKLLYD